MAQSDGRGAVGTEILAAAGAAADPDAEQLDMLMPPTRASLTAAQAERVEAAVKHDRRGRPPGARNKATREMLEFVRNLMGDPFERRFRYAMHTPETLAIELSCSKLEAYDRLDKLWADLTTYFYARQSPVDGQGNAVVPRFTMVIGGQSAPAIGAGGEPLPPWEYLRTINAKDQQNQALLEPAPARSHGERSHDGQETNDLSGLAK
jgi:hypothetical protein